MTHKMLVKYSEEEYPHILFYEGPYFEWAETFQDLETIEDTALEYWPEPPEEQRDGLWVMEGGVETSRHRTRRGAEMTEYSFEGEVRRPTKQEVELTEEEWNEY